MAFQPCCKPVPKQTVAEVAFLVLRALGSSIWHGAAGPNNSFFLLVAAYAPLDCGHSRMPVVPGLTALRLNWDAMQNNT